MSISTTSAPKPNKFYKEATSHFCSKSKTKIFQDQNDFPILPKKFDSNGKERR
jgi:hypothetical protein